MRIDSVAPHTIRRANVIFDVKVRKRFQEVVQKIVVAISDSNPSRASLPSSHEPNCLETVASNRIPFVRGDRTQVNRLAIFLTQIIEPYPGVDLVQAGIRWPC